jgi:hypothetical protein
MPPFYTTAYLGHGRFGVALSMGTGSVFMTVGLGREPYFSGASHDHFSSDNCEKTPIGVGRGSDKESFEGVLERNESAQFSVPVDCG